jgi:hypothetical protein
MLAYIEQMRQGQQQQIGCTCKRYPTDEMGQGMQVYQHSCASKACSARMSQMPSACFSRLQRLCSPVCVDMSALDMHELERNKHKQSVAACDVPVEQIIRDQACRHCASQSFNHRSSGVIPAALRMRSSV